MEERKRIRQFSPIQWFGGLQPWVRGLILNSAVLLLLVIVFFMVGSYMYGPAKNARAYYEAKLAGDWNRMYDCCVFPESSFLSKQNFVNAMSYRTNQDTDEQEMPEITSYMMRKKGTNGDQVNYQVNYSLKDDGEAHIESLVMKRGSSVLRVFSNWYVLPKDLYVQDVSVTVPKKARLSIDGTEVTEKYLTESQDEEKAVYQIPYLFLGHHTIELKERGKEDYREIFELTEKKNLEFIPEMQLNNKSGKEICDRVEEAIDAIYQAAASHKDFEEISSYFSADAATQKAARNDYENLENQFSTKKKVGIATLSVTRVTTSVRNQNEAMTADIEINYAAEKVSKRFFFFYKTKNYQEQKRLKTVVTKEDGQWLFDEGIIPS